jgi:hypothetical protein
VCFVSLLFGSHDEKTKKIQARDLIQVLHSSELDNLITKKNDQKI